MRGNPIRHMRRPVVSTRQSTHLETFVFYCSFPSLLLGGACAAWLCYRALHFSMANTAHSNLRKDYAVLFSGAVGSDVPMPAIKAACDVSFRPK